MKKRRQLVTTDEATVAERQHRKPCADCPWARTAVPGWLGSATSDEWLRDAHGETRIECHTLLGAQCAGAAIYRANVCKSVRSPDALALEPDPGRVFRSPAEFREHHARVGAPGGRHGER